MLANSNEDVVDGAADPFLCENVKIAVQSPRYRYNLLHNIGMHWKINHQHVTNQCISKCFV